MIRESSPSKPCPQCGDALIRSYERKGQYVTKHVGYYCSGDCELFLDPKEYLLL